MCKDPVFPSQHSGTCGVQYTTASREDTESLKPPKLLHLKSLKCSTNQHQNKWHQRSCSFYIDWYCNINSQLQMKMLFQYAGKSIGSLSLHDMQIVNTLTQMYMLTWKRSCYSSKSVYLWVVVAP